MPYKVKISADGSVVTHDPYGKRVPALSGELDVLKDIVESLQTNSYNDIPKEKRIISPVITVSDAEGVKSITITKEQLIHIVGYFA